MLEAELGVLFSSSYLSSSFPSYSYSYYNPSSYPYSSLNPSSYPYSSPFPAGGGYTATLNRGQNAETQMQVQMQMQIPMQTGEEMEARNRQRRRDSGFCEPALYAVPFDLDLDLDLDSNPNPNHGSRVGGHGEGEREREREGGEEDGERDHVFAHEMRVVSSTEFSITTHEAGAETETEARDGNGNGDEHGSAVGAKSETARELDPTAKEFISLTSGSVEQSQPSPAVPIETGDRIESGEAMASLPATHVVDAGNTDEKAVERQDEGGGRLSPSAPSFQPSASSPPQNEGIESEGVVVEQDLKLGQGQESRRGQRQAQEEDEGKAQAPPPPSATQTLEKDPNPPKRRRYSEAAISLIESRLRNDGLSPRRHRRHQQHPRQQNSLRFEPQHLHKSRESGEQVCQNEREGEIQRGKVYERRGRSIADMTVGVRYDVSVARGEGVGEGWVWPLST